MIAQNRRDQCGLAGGLRRVQQVCRDEGQLRRPKGERFRDQSLQERLVVHGVGPPASWEVERSHTGRRARFTRERCRNAACARS